MKEMDDRRVCILGMGYVGLTLAVVLAERGHYVSGIEIREDILERLARGQPHFYEKGLALALNRQIKRRRLHFYREIPADEEHDVYVVTVGTPLGDDDLPRMEMVQNVAKDIRDHMTDGALVILRSTVRLGTSTTVVQPILDQAGVEYDLAFCPERTIEGKALQELRTLPQIVGALTPEAEERAARFFHRLTPTIVNVSSIQAAELIKLLDNSFRDMFFSFGNEVALLTEKLGLGASEIIQAANMGYERTNIAVPGFVGGPCLHKDPHILMDSLREVGHTPQLVQTARRINHGLVEHVLNRVVASVPDLNGLRVSILGLAFKGTPENDDIRNSPSLDMIDALRGRFPRVQLRAHDHLVRDEVARSCGVEPVSLEEAFDSASVVLIMNNNPKYQDIDVETLVARMESPGIIGDCWNLIPKPVDLPNGVSLYVLGG